MEAQTVPQTVQTAIIWACQWIAMKCCATIDSAITPELFSSGRQFNILFKVFKLCQNVLNDKLVFNQVELFFSLLEFNDPTYTGDFINTISFDSTNPSFRIAILLIRDQIIEWWSRKAKVIIDTCMFQTVNTSFAEWLTERIQEIIKDLSSLFDDMVFAKTIAESLNKNPIEIQNSNSTSGLLNEVNIPQDDEISGSRIISPSMSRSSVNSWIANLRSRQNISLWNFFEAISLLRQWPLLDRESACSTRIDNFNELLLLILQDIQSTGRLGKFNNAQEAFEVIAPGFSDASKKFIRNIRDGKLIAWDEKRLPYADSFDGNGIYTCVFKLSRRNLEKLKLTELSSHLENSIHSIYIGKSTQIASRMVSHLSSVINANEYGTFGVKGDFGFGGGNTAEQFVLWNGPQDDELLKIVEYCVILMTGSCQTSVACEIGSRIFTQKCSPIIGLNMVQGQLPGHQNILSDNVLSVLDSSVIPETNLTAQDLYQPSISPFEHTVTPEPLQTIRNAPQTEPNTRIRPRMNSSEDSPIVRHRRRRTIPQRAISQDLEEEEAEIPNVIVNGRIIISHAMFQEARNRAQQLQEDSLLFQHLREAFSERGTRIEIRKGNSPANGKRSCGEFKLGELLPQFYSRVTPTHVKCMFIAGIMEEVFGPWRGVSGEKKYGLFRLTQEPNSAHTSDKNYNPDLVHFGGFQVQIANTGTQDGERIGEWHTRLLYPKPIDNKDFGWSLFNSSIKFDTLIRHFHSQYM